MLGPWQTELPAAGLWGDVEPLTLMRLRPEPPALEQVRWL